MAKPKITVLIALIGKHPQHVEHFIREKGNNLKRVHLLHTCDKDQPPSRDGDVGTSKCKHCGSGGLIDYGELANSTIKELKRIHKGIEIIPEIYDDAHDIHELQIRIDKIVREEEKDHDVILKNIALEISGGTNIAAAAQIFAIYNIGIVPFYVDNKEDEDGEWVREISVPVNWGKSLSGKAQEILKIIAESEFTVKPTGHSETPDSEEPYPVKGQITRMDLERKLGRRPSVTSLNTLKESNLIEILSEYDVYHNTSEEEDDPTWEKRTYSQPAYKTTKDGKVAVRYLDREP
ncbi:MAG: hypothetical protein HOL90_05240 [Candidatus Nitrosopelagicus sp.]|jgi:hypothetical protein|nr:hypothetical protein [Candidatus Nitrosopelagicus sp.]